MRRLASRMRRLGTETAFEVMARARALEAQGRSVIHLEIGEPDFDTPPAVAEAGIAAIRRGETHYTPSAGTAELRGAVARYVSRTRGLPVGPEEVIVTPGAKPVMFYAILALLEEGDECISPGPGFPIYASMVEFAGARLVPLPLREENDFGIDVDELRRLVTPRTKLVILNSPHNPTGGVLASREVEGIAELAVERDLWVLSDEIYSEIVYDVPFTSPWAQPGMRERTVLLHGFSKTFAMTGWRLGYGVFPDELVEPVTKLVTNSVSCTATFTQHAGIAALEARPAEVDAMLRAFRARRDRVVRGLDGIDGIGCRAPHGAFYAFPNVTRLGLTAAVCARRLLEEAGVACLAGTAFGPEGEGHLRISYAASLDALEEAVARIGRWVRSAELVRA